MSKNFEEAYKAEVLNDIPDLWDRIEAGLTPREVTVVPDVSQEEQKLSSKKKKKSFYKFMYVAMPMAAVVLLFLISIPVILTMVMGRTFSNDYAPSPESVNGAIQDTGYIADLEAVMDSFAGDDSAKEEVAAESLNTNKYMADEESVIEESTAITQSSEYEPEIEVPEKVTGVGDNSLYQVVKNNLEVNVIIAEDGMITIVPVNLATEELKTLLGEHYPGYEESGFAFLYSLESTCEPEAGKKYLCRIQEEDEGEALYRIVLIEEVTP